MGKKKRKKKGVQIQPLLWGDSASRIGHQRKLCIQGVPLTFYAVPTGIYAREKAPLLVDSATFTAIGLFRPCLMTTCLAELTTKDPISSTKMTLISKKEKFFEIAKPSKF
jgi:hypothetical protein